MSTQPAASQRLALAQAGCVNYPQALALTITSYCYVQGMVGDIAYQGPGLYHFW